MAVGLVDSELECICSQGKIIVAIEAVAEKSDEDNLSGKCSLRAEEVEDCGISIWLAYIGCRQGALSSPRTRCDGLPVVEFR